ncbi:hypothetical protein [Ketobacter sp.]|uniref:hypothetical protein n=1 Tax=Ketobacter sp. TaxID=2083498 RepID=UPI000F24C948|nr:hypothetical protein [Ketobacter sp.]RLU00600.1 MAG: DNA-binding protein [Ketobacter sp.]
MNNTPKPRRLATVKNTALKYPDANITESSLRWLIFNGHENGFNKCIVRIGRKILIDLELLELWMDEQAANGGAA